MRKSRYTMAFPVKDKYLLVNGLSGAVTLVSKERAQDFFDGKATDELTPFFTTLTPEEEEEKAIFMCDFLMRKATECVDGCIAVTYDCNLRCPYCYEIWAKRPEMMNPVVDEYKVDKAFEALEYLNRKCTGKKPLTLTGGEPLLKKNQDIIKYIFEKGADLGYTFIVFTNGIELDHFLSAIVSAPVEYVQITLDGPPSLHNKRRIYKKGKGTFNTIVKNIEKARETGITTVIRTNADSEILNKIDELAQFFKERKWVKDPHIYFALVHLCGQRLDPENLEEYINLYQRLFEVAKRPELKFFDASPFPKLRSLRTEHPRFWPSFWNCDAVSRRYVFDPFGYVYPCRTMLGWEEQRIGEYIPELKFNENNKKWRERTIFNLKECAECDIALVCGGDCGHVALLHNKSLYQPVCSRIERFVTPYLEYLYEERNL